MSAWKPVTLLAAQPEHFDPHFLETLLPLLPQSKRRALQKIQHAQTRRESLLAWALLAWAATQRGKEAALPEPKFAQNGKPYFEGSSLQFNLSHTQGWVCAALNEQGAVGVDVQMITQPSEGVARRVLTEAEQALLAQSENRALCFTELWARKEAYIKYTGEGLSCSLQTLDFSPFCSQSSFAAFGAYFNCFLWNGAAAALCTQQNAPVSFKEIKQSELQQMLRESAAFETERGVFG